MDVPSAREAGLPAASDAQEAGRISALAVRCERDLYQVADRYEPLFPNPPIGPHVYSGTALACAFISPWSSAAQLQPAARTSLWIFGVDELIDHQARHQAQVDDVVTGCGQVARGGDAQPWDPAARLLAELRDELAHLPGFPTVQPLWTAEVERMLSAMNREWGWKTAQAGAATGPGLEDYLANADNFGSCLVSLAHWIRADDPATLAHLEELLAVGREVQQVLRLCNDLASYRRDIDWDDLNVLMLGLDEAAVRRLIGDREREITARLSRLHPDSGRGAQYLARQMDYTLSFYGHGGEFWG